jgi:HSP20 family molecular chaperone IbpA
LLVAATREELLINELYDEGTHMLEIPKICKVTNKVAFDDARTEFAEWMTVNEDLVFRPSAEISKEENEFVVKVLVPGRKHKGVEVWIAPDMVLVKGEINRGQAGRMKLFRSITFPRSVNPDTVHAVIDDGMLSIRAEIAGAYKGITITPLAA